MRTKLKNQKEMKKLQARELEFKWINYRTVN